MIVEHLSVETVLFIFALLAGLYMAWNIGANDVANAIGTSVGSGTLTLRRAVIMAACMEFIGAFFFGSHVTETIQTGIISPDIYIDRPLQLVYGMLSALLAAGVWLQCASYFGLPVSTTHSIIGAIVGFGVVSSGVDAINWRTVFTIGGSWVISPLLGGLFSYAIFNLLRYHIFYTRHPVEAARKLSPLIIFAAVTVLTYFLIMKGLTDVHLSLGVFQTGLLSLGVAFVTAVASHFWIRRIAVPQTREKKSLPYGPEIAVELEKARKHLQRVQISASGEMLYSVSAVIDELNAMAETIKQPTEESDNSEYKTVETIFGFLQILSAGLMAFAHGANDVANAIGPLAACIGILMNGTVAFDPTIPPWLLALGGVGIVTGLATWGWRVVDTIGKKITELTPSRGFSAEFGAASTIVLASGLGLPISTTHTLVGAVFGIACARGIMALNLASTRDILISWLITVPAGAGLAIGFYYLIQAVMP